MKVALVQTISCVVGTVPKWLVKGLEDWVKEDDWLPF